jgi:signal transduction histidine kinase
VQLEVVDDGQGFDPQQPTVDRGFGLIGMQERSQRLGGRFSLVSQPGSGTTILVTVPTSGGQAP